MVIYVDRLLAVNALVNYLLLSITARLSGEAASQRRRALAAVGGALYALAVLLPGCRMLGVLTLRLLSAALMTAAAFGIGRRLPRQWLLVLALSALYGGVVLAVETLLGGSVTFIDGIACYPVSFRALALTACGVWLLFSTVLARLGAHSGGDLAQTVLTLHGRDARCMALRDTGNSLCDPVSGQPALIVEWSVLRPLLPGAPERLPTDPVAVLEALRRADPTLRLRLLPYRTVGSSGLLPAVRCDRITLDGKAMPGALAAISSVSDGGAFHALTGGL